MAFFEMMSDSALRDQVTRNQREVYEAAVTLANAHTQRKLLAAEQFRRGQIEVGELMRELG